MILSIQIKISNRRNTIVVIVIRPIRCCMIIERHGTLCLLRFDVAAEVLLVLHPNRFHNIQSRLVLVHEANSYAVVHDVLLLLAQVMLFPVARMGTSNAIKGCRVNLIARQIVWRPSEVGRIDIGLDHVLEVWLVECSRLRRRCNVLVERRDAPWTADLLVARPVTIRPVCTSRIVHLVIACARAPIEHEFDTVAHIRRAHFYLIACYGIGLLYAR